MLQFGISDVEEYMLQMLKSFENSPPEANLNSIYGATQLCNLLPQWHVVAKKWGKQEHRDPVSWEATFPW